MELSIADKFAIYTYCDEKCKDYGDCVLLYTSYSDWDNVNKYNELLKPYAALRDRLKTELEEVVKNYEV